MEWDYTVFKYINDLANDQSFFGKLVVTAADRGDIFFFLSLVVIMLFHRKMGIYGFIAAGFSVAFSRSFSLLYYRDRPFVTHEVNQLLPHIESNSFPSDHAVAAFTIAIMIFLFSRWLGSAYIVFASIVILLPHLGWQALSTGYRCWRFNGYILSYCDLLLSRENRVVR